MSLRLLTILVFTVFLSACKLALIMVEGGEVQSVQSGPCLSGRVCIQEITAADFSETYTAVAEPGWVFDGWVAGDNFLCSQITEPTCALSNFFLNGNGAAETIIVPDVVYYAMPRVKRLASAPIEDTVMVAGFEWAQVDLFLDLPSSDINAACPAGVCANGQVMAGYDMSGRTWASLGDVGDLFHEITPHPVGIAQFSEIFIGAFQWADDFMDELGFRSTFEIAALQARAVSGYVSGLGVEPKAHIQRFVLPE